MWHYRFWLDGREYTGNTDLVATERNRNAAARKEAKARELVLNGRAHELKLEVKPFSDAAAKFLKWADGEYRESPKTAIRLRTSFASLGQFFRVTPVSAILPGHVDDFKSWRRTEHEVREVTIRHDLHALSKAFGYWIRHNWARENPVRGVEIPSDKDAVRIHVLTAEEEVIYFDAARRRLKLSVESLRICAKRASLASPWLFPGKLPGTHLAKLNGPHGRVLDDLAVCACAHRRASTKKGNVRAGARSSKRPLASRS
jgi:hypothetical protein